MNGGPLGPLYHEYDSKDRVAAIYAADIKSARYMQQSVAIPQYQLALRPETEEWVKDRRLSELGDAFVRMLFEEYEGKPVKIVVSQTARNDAHIPEFRHMYRIGITPLQEVGK